MTGRLLVGSYTEGGGDGIRLVAHDGATGALTLEATLEGAPDASYFAHDRKTGRLYVTDEPAGRLGAFVLSEEATRLVPLGYRPTEAKYPCYVSLSPDNAYVAVANYGADLAAVFTIEADGGLRSDPQRLRGTQSSDKGHAHWVQWSPEGDRIYVVDLGHDEIRSYPIDRASGQAGAPQVAFSMPPGSGPRHLAFHPNGGFAYCLTEYANTLTAFAREADGELRELGTFSTLPSDYSGKSSGAHIQLSRSGDMAYVSNRGHNSIAAFRLGSDGMPAHLQTVDCGGDWPRFFLLLDRHLIVANQESGDLCVLEVAADGTLHSTGQRLALPKPVMILEL